MPFSNNHMSSNIFFNNHDQDHDDDDDDGDDGDDDGRICVFCGNGNGIVKVGRMHLHHAQVFPRSRGPPTSLVHIGLSLFCRLCEFLDANPSLSWNFCGRSSTVVFFVGGVFLCFARVLKKDGLILEQITGASLVYLTIYISYYCNCHLPIDPFLVVFHGARYYRQKVRSLEGLPLPGRGLARVIYPDEQRARDILKESWNAEFFVVENCWVNCGEKTWGKNYGDE